MTPLQLKRITALALIMTLTGSATQAQTLDEKRRESIVRAFNQTPEEIVSPLTVEQVKLNDGQGRIDVNVDAKFSYFAQTLAPENAASPTLLIPMATSRFTPTYYQTDEWWDAHKEEIEAARRAGTPTPKQDMDEVALWLNQQKLSTNPFVLKVHGNSNLVERIRLQDFLRDYIIDNYAKDGFITLYRGGEKAGEVDKWTSGVKPAGARYWTPTALYAWRYARKNRAFIEELVSKRAPLFVFKIPVSDFRAMTTARWPRLTLGTELTKNAHSAFDSKGVFMDHLYQTEYLGEGGLGVEIELRSNRKGAQDMVRYFKQPITIEELANDRIAVLKKAAKRLKSTYPAKESSIESSTANRIERTLAEARLLIAIRELMPREVVADLLNKISGHKSEIAYIDGSEISSFAREKMGALPSDPSVRVDVHELDSKFGLGMKAQIQRAGTCGNIF